MKKKFQFFISAFFLFFSTINAQTIVKNPDKKEIIIGIQTRAIDLLPFEFSLMAYKQTKFSYTLKLGLNYFKKNIFDDVYKYQSGSVSNRTFSHDQKFKAIYIKPGINFINRPDKRGENFVNFNAVFTYAFETFELTSEDKIYGKVTQNFTEENVYAGLEMEYLKIYNSGISIGGIVGYKLINTVPFKNIVQGLENASTFSPGMGFGKTFYFNISIGYYIFQQ
ncbi:MAG: hypothetical protein WCI53_13900 [Bacteroidota bacterium]|jgi:hypothetical protein